MLSYRQVTIRMWLNVVLGPTNFHGYQEKILEMHRSRFSNLSLEDYKKRITSESGEEIVEQWKASMAKRTIYKLKKHF